MNYWLIVGTMLSTSLLGQQATNPPAAAPIATPAAAPALTTNAPAPGATNAPATKAKKSGKKGKKKGAGKKKAPAPELKTVPLVAGPAEVVASNVNVRGQAKLKSEVVTRVTKGDQVTVIEEIVRNNSAVDEPSAWAKILLPPKAHVWVNTEFVEPTNKTITASKLNLRSGPGENYSVLGLLERGDTVKELNTKGAWTEIEAPTNAFAFMAAQYLKQEPAGTPPALLAAMPAEPAATPAPVNEAPTVAAAPAEPPALPGTVENPAATNMLANAATNAASATNAPEPAPEEPPPPRIVQHEGIVRGITSIQAPTHFALISPENGKTINYLYTTSPSLDLRRYKGLRIVVTGEEGLDERWKSTPVITIEKIQVVD